MRKWVVGGAAAAVALGAFAYLGHELKAIQAEEDAKGDAEILKDRLRPAARKHTGLAGIRDMRSFMPLPVGGCSPLARPLVERAVAAQGIDPSSLDFALKALEADPGCAAAGRIGSIMARRTFGLGTFRKQAELRAAAAPGNAGAQLVAAYACNEDDDGPAMRRFLDRAEAADPRAPLLAHATGNYHLDLADPVDLGAALADFQEEERRTGDPGSILNQARIYGSMDDLRPALQACQRLADAGHATDVLSVVDSCSGYALRLADPSAPEWVARLEKVHQDNVSTDCQRADFGHVYLASGHYQEALEAARKGPKCPQVAREVERWALLSLGRFEEAAAVPYSPSELAQEGYPRALALALSGRRDEARDLLTPLGASDKPAWDQHILQLLLDRGISTEWLKTFVAHEGSWSPAEQEARSACGHLSAGLVEEATAPLQRALALDPRNASAHRCRVYQLSLQNKLAEAAAAGEASLAQGIQAVRANLGFVYLKLDRCEEAVPLLQGVVKDHPFDAPAYGNLYACLTKLGRSEDAREIEPFLAATPVGVRTWQLVLLAFLVVPLYLGGKLVLKLAWPRRFGHLRFP